jgi:uncharacterized DUF497 family protein
MIVWDPSKAQRNMHKHGVGFEEAATVYRDPLVLFPHDLAHSGDEDRWIALGKSLRQILLAVVHTEDDRTIRIVSARKAEPRERRQYEQQFQEP